MTTTLLELRGLDLPQAGAGRRVGWTLESGGTGLVCGPPGTGKTACLDLVSGQRRAAPGQVFLAGQDIGRLGAPARARAGIARSLAGDAVLGGLSVLDHVCLALRRRLGRGPGLFARRSGDWELLDSAERLLQQVRLLALAEQPARSLGRAERRRMDLAMLMAQEPRLYVLDAPLAGLDGAGAAAMRDLLAGLSAAGATLLLALRDPRDLDLQGQTILQLAPPGETGDD
ncbi:ATP-binding cassette domain-containing protein [Mangrovicoccus algicola]|uniref:ATP-binding cassette domain-containing protein n=1 Tax=Mangrovicoccus algicola TaxID=2771008 RepID=A0A8J6YWL4_9RHOB|nr:ATP-binding cassette domain-containing protein [Mangrovicoccus algicola]MBE3637131.1 ATP-binding cassette domain-containing protein [Mangrovicoccus algicola]